MGGFLSFKLAPGVRISASSRGLRGHLGPRAARVHVGGGRSGMSTGAGPFTAYQSLGGSSRRQATPRTSGVTPAQAQRFAQVEAVRTELTRLESLHRTDFSGPVREVVPKATLPPFAKLLVAAEKQAFAGVRRRDRAARFTAQTTARVTAERWARDLMVLAEGERRSRQDVIDARWSALRANDTATMSATLVTTFASRPHVRIAGVHAGEAGLVVTLPGLGLVPDRKPAVTPSGAPTLRPMGQTERNEWYADVAAAHVLLAAKEAFVHAPGLTAARVVAVDTDGVAVIGARVVREGLASADWTRRAWPVLWDAAPGLRVDVRGRTRQLVTIDLRSDETFGPVLAAR